MDMAGNGIGGIHLHVDAAGTSKTDKFLASVVKWLKEKGIGTNITEVVEAVGGPQRKKIPHTYKHHTPGDGTKEEFGSLLTTGFRSRGETVEALRWMLPRLQKYPGVVIEVERVFALAKQDGSWDIAPKDAQRPFTAEEVGFKTVKTHPIEVHYAIDMWGGDDPRLRKKPVEMSQLLSDTNSRGIEVGGWFRFAMPGGVWAYRSNMFCDDDLSFDELSEHHRVLRECFARYGYIYRVRIFVEQVLGIWKAGVSA
jgi:hypothetical protein